MSVVEVFVVSELLHCSWSEALCSNLTFASWELECVCRELKPAGIQMQRVKLFTPRELYTHPPLLFSCCFVLLMSNLIFLPLSSSSFSIDPPTTVSSYYLLTSVLHPSPPSFSSDLSCPFWLRVTFRPIMSVCISTQRQRRFWSQIKEVSGSDSDHWSDQWMAETGSECVISASWASSCPSVLQRHLIRIEFRPCFKKNGWCLWCLSCIVLLQASCFLCVSLTYSLTLLLFFFICFCFGLINQYKLLKEA